MAKKDEVKEPKEATVGVSELAAALTAAIQAARPEKKNPFNRKVGTPWTPKDGSKKLKLKRKIYQHGLPIDEDIIDNEEIALLNQLRPGLYLDGVVKVNRRKDRALDISYPMKTSAQRLKLINQFGIRNLKELVAKCIEEAAKPKTLQEAAEFE
jgi:hypothetical protein